MEAQAPPTRERRTVSELNHWETTDGVIALFGIARGTLYRWASEDRWRRRGTRRARLWNIEDVQRSHDTRRAELDTADDQGRR